jgi:eukaryotic-like serine/threonine-protein kinase
VSGLSGIAGGLHRATPKPPSQLTGSSASGKEPPLRYIPGGVIGSKYRLERVLGEGGMGAVWLARNMALDVDVAIKLIRRELAAKESADRLLHEARSAARIDHPSIVRIYDFGETEYKDPYIVMELLQGESLREVLDRKGTLPAVNAVQTLLPIGSALVAAHAKGIIHRDLKPENVIVVKDERGMLLPKVVDFGIAKMRHAREKTVITQVGVPIGSPDYMSPEQARGRTDVDERTDVWSLAVVLYELVTGKCPFVGAHYNAQILAIIENAPVSTAALGASDEELWSILEKGLEKDKEARWPSVRAFGTALAGWCVGQAVDTDITGALIALEWIDAGARRPLSERPPSLESTRAAGLSMRASLLPGDDPARLSAAPPSVPPAAVPSSIPPPLPVAPEPPPPSSKRPPPLPRRPPARPPPPVKRAEAPAAAPPAPPPPKPPVAAAPAPPVVAPRAPPVAAPPPPPVAAPPPARAAARPALPPISARPPADARPQTSAPKLAPRARARWPLALGALVLLAIGGLVLGRTLSLRPASVALEAAPARSVEPTAADTSSAPAPAPRPPASASAPSEASAAPPASASAAPSPPPDAAACARTLFPEGTFDPDKPPSFEQICTENDPRRGASLIKSEVVRRRGSDVSEAMREWAMLSWYELAAFAVVRGACCPQASPMKLPPPVGRCEAVDGKLDELARAVAAGESTDASIAGFRSAVACVIASGVSADYGYVAPLRGGEETAFRKTLSRAPPKK